MSDAAVKAITRALANPFDAKEVKWKPQTAKGNRAMAVAYIDARLIQDRLDDVLGVEGWQDEYELLPDGSVMCRLRLRLGDEWVTKMDVGSPSEQPDGGDRLKAAFSDALKRAAVKFGIGRYLYRLPTQWVDYDPQKRQFTQTPKLPDFALPGGKPSGEKRPAPGPQQAAPADPPPARPSGEKPAAEKALPADGRELKQRLQALEDQLVAAGRCASGELLAFVLTLNADGWGGDMLKWDAQGIERAAHSARRFLESHPAPADAGAGPALKMSAARRRKVRDYQKLLEWDDDKLASELEQAELPRLDELTEKQATALCELMARHLESLTRLREAEAKAAKDRLFAPGDAREGGGVPSHVRGGY